MIEIAITKGHHNWSKQNLVTVNVGKKGTYDIVKCTGCGMIGKRTSLVTVTLKSSYKISKIEKCSAYIPPGIEELSQFKYTVIESPWSDKLPKGTEIIPAKSPVDSNDEDWYKRKDGEILYKEESHGCFKLYKNEVKKESL